MGLFARLAGWRKKDAATSTDEPAPWFREWAGGGSQSSAGVRVSQQAAMRDMTFMSCVSIRAGDLAKCPVHINVRAKDGGQVIARDHPLEQLLQQPNGWQNRMQFVEQLQSALLIRSNAYAGILRNARGQPVELVPFWPTGVKPMVSSSGALFFLVVPSNAHERIQLARFPLNPIPVDDMLHISGLSFDGISGLSRLALMREALGLSLALAEHSSRLFSNGARPGGVLETDNRLSDEVYARFHEQWREYVGLENTGKTPILEEGLKWSPQGMTAVESQTIEARKLQREEIAMACDVPLHRLGIIQDRDSAIVQAQQLYRNNTLSGDAERWEIQLAHTFGLTVRDAAREGEYFAQFDLDYFNRADIQTRMTAYRTGIVGMIYTPNEARGKEGLPRQEGGDTLYQPTNVAPIGFKPQGGGQAGPGSDVTGEPAPGGDGDPAAVQLEGFDDLLAKLDRDLEAAGV
jgi:HK97 family phage portal protein